MKEKFICEHCNKDFENKEKCKSHEVSCLENKSDERITVIEGMIITQTMYENARYYMVEKKTVPIVKDLALKFKNTEDKEDIVDLLDSLDMDEYFGEVFSDLYYEYLLYHNTLKELLDDSGISGAKGSLSFNSYKENQEYYHYHNATSYAEIHINGFSSEYNFNNGYFHILEINKDELIAHDKVSIEFSPRLSSNRPSLLSEKELNIVKSLNILDIKILKLFYFLDKDINRETLEDLLESKVNLTKLINFDLLKMSNKNNYYILREEGKEFVKRLNFKIPKL